MMNQYPVDPDLYFAKRHFSSKEFSLDAWEMFGKIVVCSNNIPFPRLQVKTKGKNEIKSAVIFFSEGNSKKKIQFPESVFKDKTNDENWEYLHKQFRMYKLVGA